MTTATVTRTCVVCNQRPARRGTKFCWHCTKAAKEDEPERLDLWRGVRYVLVWMGPKKGQTVGSLPHIIKLVVDQAHRDADGQPMLKPVYVGQMKAPRALPVSVELIDLSASHLPYDSKVVRRMKQAFYDAVPKVRHTAADGSWRMVPLL